MTDNYVIPWSGGVDSTMALMECLSKSVVGKVRAITFDLQQIAERQRKFEKRARERLKKWMSKTHGYRFNHETVTINGYPFGGQCAQPIIWLGLTAASTKPGETAVFSWLKTDYPPTMVPQLIEAWKQLALVNGGNSELHLPYLEQSKAWVQESAHVSDVLDKCWYCEGTGLQKRSPVPCGTCECCISFKAAEFERGLRWPKAKKITKGSGPLLVGKGLPKKARKKAKKKAKKKKSKGKKK